MKTLITVLALAALATTSALAQAPKVKAIRANSANIYQSDAQGNQPSLPAKVRKYSFSIARIL